MRTRRLFGKSGVRIVMGGIILMAYSLISFSQSPKRANIWYFGEQAGLDFSQGHPVVLTDGAMKAFEGSAVMCDKSGNLLFYTNGGDMPYSGGIWNRHHQLMPNGDLTGGGGCGSSFQSALIVPHPKYENLYYLFTTDCIENGSSGGLRYSVIDMLLDRGLGDVAVKDVLLTTPVDESLTAIQHANGIDYWIISHKLHTDSFYVYHLTSHGITGLVKSKTGPVTPDYAGSLKASINGEKIVYSGLTFTALFDFNKATGVISNPIDLGIPSYSASFSPNCRLLYAANGVNRRLFQFDLLSHDIPSTAVQVGSTSSTGFGGMQLGNDNRIYIARFVTSNYLGVIMHPDIKGDDCLYADDGVYLGGRQGKGGLPNFPNNIIGECQSYPEENVSDYTRFDLRVKNTGRNHFTLTWNDESGSHSGYRVMMKKKGSKEWVQQFTQSNSASFSDLSPGTTYNVKVFPLNENNPDYQFLSNHFVDELRDVKSRAAAEKNEVVVTTLNNFDFSICPNPAVNTATVIVTTSIASPVDIFVIEMNGKILQEHNYDDVSGLQEFSLQLDKLTNGIYNIAVQTDETHSVKKLIVLE
ncbi:MAG TPA: fibronectin type III domain-containing protein [Chitinophagales bacterium]|nr:fibronectin type III domain-containing protein [Chitinophagales bacterium]